MTDLDMVIKAAGRALDKGREFANGPAINPDHYPAMIQALGLLEVFRDELVEVQSQEMPQ